MTRQIQTTNPNLVALVSDEDYELVSAYTWHIMNNGYTNYAYAWNPYPKALLMHRLILDPPKGYVVDHENRNGLHNTRTNIRIVSYSTNGQRVPKVLNRLGGVTSKYKGVQFEKSRNKWKVTITSEYKTIYVGRFDDEIEAALAYDEAARKIYGDLAYTNFGPGDDTEVTEEEQAGEG